MKPREATFEIVDRLHARTARVPGDRIADTVSRWLAELGATSPLVDDLASAARAGNWTAAHTISDYLSVQVAVAR